MDMNAGTAETLARAAMAAQDWPEALRLWRTAHAMNPTVDPHHYQRGIARLHIEQAAALGGGTPASIERVENPEAHALLLQFESLGENCEFGLVQRRFSAEPLGFLRWTYISARTLIRLLESGFNGIGELENLEMTRASWGEYILNDKTHGVFFHTYIDDCGPDEARFLQKQSARLVWLKRKLFADLTEGNKTFVYKAQHGPSDAAMTRIASLIGELGSNNLLYVRASGSEAIGGSIKQIGERLIVGYLTRVEPTSQGCWDILYDEWLAICQEVSHMWHY